MADIDKISVWLVGRSLSLEDAYIGFDYPEILNARKLIARSILSL